jgi:hypothetical protein
MPSLSTSSVTTTNMRTQTSTTRDIPPQIPPFTKHVTPSQTPPTASLPVSATESKVPALKPAKKTKKLPRQVSGEAKCGLPPSSLLRESLPPSASSVQSLSAAAPSKFARGPRLHIPLLDICKLNTPLVKRVPNSQRSSFAVEWGRLLSQALADELEVSWSEFFTFPRCILWSPPRGGRRVTKKAKFNEVVKARLTKWSKGGQQELWAEVVKRSRKQFEEVPAQPRQRDGKRLEAAVISALRMGDVRKALQLLNSSPIAPKTEATLQRLKDLHPKGPLPEPLPPVPRPENIPHFTDDLVRSALSTFGPARRLACSESGHCCFSRQPERKPTASEAR